MSDVLTKEYLIEKGAIHEIGKIYRIGFYKVGVFEDGFVFFLSSSLLGRIVRGKTKKDFNEIYNKLKPQ